MLRNKNSQFHTKLNSTVTEEEVYTELGSRLVKINKIIQLKRKGSDV